MRPILVVAAFVFASSCAPVRQVIRLDTYKKNEDVKQYKDILITGEGNMQARMYLKNLTDILTAKLKKKNIICRYEFLGDYHKIDTDEVFKTVKAGQYDAIIRMLPRKLEEKEYEIQSGGGSGTTPGIAIPGGGTTPSMTTTTPHQTTRLIYILNDFDLTLWDKTGAVVWEGRLKTEIDPVAKALYRKIGVKMMSTFTENKIVPAK